VSTPATRCGSTRICCRRRPISSEPAGFVDRVIGGDTSGIDIDAVIAEFEKDIHEHGSDEPDGPVDS
jgi:hypothetical protein